MQALEDVSLSLDAGERLALVGENGAGKSTLMNVLCGLYAPSSGEVQVSGKPVRFKSAREALGMGIAMVHQHFTLAPSLTVAENVVLGTEPRRGLFFDTRAAETTVARTSARFGFALDPRARVGELSVAAQQKVEIVKALHRQARVLILDEPTAVLAPPEVEGLWRTVRALSESGVAVILIAHKLREVLEVATRVAVMRRGRMVAETKAEGASREQLAAWMLGDAKAKESAAAAPPTPRRGTSVVALDVQQLCAPPRLRGVSFSVSEGEIVGIAGVDGNGQRELTQALTGLAPWTEGSVRVGGHLLPPSSPSGSRARGVAHIPEDRAQHGVVGPLRVEENLVLGRAGRPLFARGPFIQPAARRAHAERMVASFDIRPADPRAVTSGLSGGNQQKVVLARELTGDPLVIVAVQPTRGLDFSAVALVHRKLREARDAGAAVLLVSLDLDELLTLSDRVLVLSGGRIRTEFGAPPFSAREVGQAMLAVDDPEVATHG